MKRFSFMIILIFCLLTAINAFGEENILYSGSCGDNAYWSLSEDGKLLIWGNGTVKNDPWKDYKYSVVDLVVSEGITSFERLLDFEMYQNLKSVELPSGFTEIGIGLFQYCYNLKTINIPEGVTAIGRYAFDGCNGLTEIALPASLTLIDHAAFSGCGRLQSVTIPENVTIIGDRAFASCYSLKTAYFLGDAPREDYLNLYFLQNVFTSSTTLYYRPEKTGWKTPLWHGYPCYPICERGHMDEYGVPLFGERPDDWQEEEYPATIDAYTPVSGTEHLVTREWIFICDACKQKASVTTQWNEKHEYTESGSECVKCKKIAPCRLGELTVIDYLAFASLAYEDAPTSPITIQEMLSSKWVGAWEKTDITYYELFDHIKDWRFLKHSENKRTGFYAMAFVNGANEVVITYRGSNPELLKVFILDKDAWLDWLINDVPAIFGSHLNDYNQIYDAFAFYNEVVEGRSKDQIGVAGHSLGGALADAVSAHSGCYGRTVNAISALDALYTQWPFTMSQTFTGIDDWNFIDIVNDKDHLAGRYGVELKPANIHESLHTAGLNGTAFGDHSIQELLYKDGNGQIVMTKRLVYNQPTSLTWRMNAKFAALQLGMSQRDDVFVTMVDNNNLFGIDLWFVSYGGDGDDMIVTGKNNDTLIGGRGNDYLDGGTWGNDQYIYNKGDGIDYIVDTVGRDTIYLQGFDVGDEVLVLPAYEIRYSHDFVDENGRHHLLTSETKTGAVYSVIMCNGEPIIYLDKNRADNILNKLTLNIGGEERDITSEIQPAIVTIVEHLEFSCPIDIDILDADGNVVYTVKDSQLGNFYTDYGNFYVLPNEDSQYNSKILDIFEGYTVKIRGIGEGTMSVLVQDTDNYELLDACGTTDVAITPDTVGTLVTDEDTGITYLLIDANNDGTTDETIPLTPVHMDADDHDQPMQYVAGTPATCIAAGQLEHYVCSCGKIFFDSKGEKEVTDIDDLILPANGIHQYVNGVCSACGDRQAEVPKTGDATPLVLLMALVALSIGSVIVIGRKMKKG